LFLEEKENQGVVDGLPKTVRGPATKTLNVREGLELSGLFEITYEIPSS